MLLNRYKKTVLIYSALVIGGGSLILFCLFLLFGPFALLDFGMNNEQALAFDSILCLLFFIQHSVLIRKSMRSRFEKHIPSEFYGAFYATSSGIALLMMTLLWQKTFVIATAGAAAYWFLRALFVLSIAGFYWGVASLGSFDPFGIKKIKTATLIGKLKPVDLTVKGPYLWIRHPLYFFSLIMIWSSPDLTADRLLFNILWTLWIVMATKLEERDLLAEFGNKYREYQAMVPMLVPYKLPARKDTM
jgi:protein-S-isoprenylcysteine O-methyltransferase Ste14